MDRMTGEMPSPGAPHPKSVGRARCGSLLTAVLCAAMWLLAFGAGPVVAASGEPIVVEADDYGFWDGRERVFIARGNVRVTHGDRYVEADTMHYDLDAEEARFEGNVLYRDTHNELRGSALRYHVGREEGWLDNAEGILYPVEHADGTLGDPVFLFGERIHRDTRRIQLQRARLTTCGPGEPPYHLAAREVEIYPGDRIVIRGVTFVEHGIPLMYWPYFVLSLKERQNRFDFPQVGYSEEDGWFIRTAYNYYLDSGGYGAAYLDYYQRRGRGFGARHVYHDTGKERGEAYAYTVRNREGGDDYEFEWIQNWAPSQGLQLETRAFHKRSDAPGRATIETWQGRAAANGTLGRGHFDLRLDYDIDPPNQKDKIDAYGRLRYSLPHRWNLDLRGSYLREASLDGLNLRGETAYLARLQRSWSGYSLTIEVEQRLHPEIRQGIPADDWRSMHRMPEITLSTTRRPLGVPLVLRGSVGHFREYPGDVEGWRGSVSGQVPSYSLRLTPRSTFIARGTVSGFAYENGQQQIGIDSRLSWNYRPFRPLRLTLDFDYREAWGETPFRFDRFTPRRTLSPAALWWQGPWQTRITGRYDLLAEQWSPLLAQVSYRPNRNFYGSLYATYDLEEASFETLVASVELSDADRYRVRAAAAYDVPTASWTRWDIAGSIPLGGGWSIAAEVIYHVDEGRFGRGAFRLTKDLSCREISLTYDHIEGEYWLEYRIYAFPFSRVRVGRSEEEPFMFESDLLEELLR